VLSEVASTTPFRSRISARPAVKAGRSVAAGVYFVELRAGSESRTVKLVRAR